MIDLTQDSPPALLQLLPIWNTDEQVIESTVAGDSNMNLVLRIQTNQRSLILKQSKPYVRKYQHIPAPVERIGIEKEFLDQLMGDPVLASRVPKVLFYDENLHLMGLEDLGKGTDFVHLYQGKTVLSTAELDTLMDFLVRLHQVKPSKFPSTQAMRKLNHEHLFDFPFREENGFDLDTVQQGLQAASLPYKTAIRLKAKIKTLGQHYLHEKGCLIHGDFYPGSWLAVDSGLKVIDPEFGGLGQREFDLGVCLAHLDLAAQPPSLDARIRERYSLAISWDLVQAYRGIEILRRLIGIAQLPLTLSLDEKKVLLSRAHTYLLP
jgi:5-methylthioribose kinase